MIAHTIPQCQPGSAEVVTGEQRRWIEIALLHQHMLHVAGDGRDIVDAVDGMKPDRLL